PAEPLRPRDLALLLLASGDLLPRQRARDQQADLAGLRLKRTVLDRLMALDPEPEDLEAALVRIVEEAGPPTGPQRAVAAARVGVARLLRESVRDSGEGGRRGGRLPS